MNAFRHSSLRRGIVCGLIGSLALSSSLALAAPDPKGAGAAATATGHADDIALAVGETKTIPATGVRQYSVAAEDIAAVTPTPEGSQFVISGRKPGSTTLLLIKNDGTRVTYDINVALRSPQAVEKEVAQLIEGIPGLRTRRIGARIFLEGGVSSESDLKRIQSIAQSYNGQVESLVSVGQSPAERKLLVRVDFFFVRYQKSRNFAVGLGWPASIGGGLNLAGQPVAQNQFTFDFVSKTATTAQASIVDQPLPRLDISSTRGWAKVLKQATVVTSNGSEALFNSGEEQNYVQTAGAQVGLVKVFAGTNVKVLPRYDTATKDCEVKITTDFSEFTPAVSGSVPGRNTTNLETLVTLKLGQAVILSGLHTAELRNDNKGLPFISEVPVIGLLFGTQDRAYQEVEGALFIVPSIIDSVPKSSLELIKSAVDQYKEFSGDIETVDTFPKAPPSAK
jgi:pilus assembly protein CpaC